MPAAINTGSLLALVSPILLGGCVAAAIPAMTAMQVGSFAYGSFSMFKAVQLSTGGSVEVGISDANLTSEQRSRIKKLRSIAVWPDPGNGGVALAEALQASGRFEVITPAQVRPVLKKLGESNNLAEMTTAEAKSLFAKVCQQTGADSIVSDRSAGGKTETNMWSFDRARVSTDLIVFIYECAGNAYIAELPLTVRVLLGGSSPNASEITKVANTELAKAIVALAENPALTSAPAGRTSATPAAPQPTQGSPAAVTSEPAPKPMTIKEVQERLIALGYKPGVSDGVMGRRTIDALRAFQRDSGIPETGKVDAQTLLKLQAK